MKACIAIVFPPHDYLTSLEKVSEFEAKGRQIVTNAAPVENWKEELLKECTTRLSQFVTVQSDGLKSAVASHPNGAHCTDLATALFQLESSRANLLFKTCIWLSEKEVEAGECCEESESKVVTNVAKATCEALICINRS